MKVTADGVPVQDVITAIKLAIKEANVSATDEYRDLLVGSVKLVLHVLATRTTGGAPELHRSVYRHARQVRHQGHQERHPRN